MRKDNKHLAKQLLNATAEALQNSSEALENILDIANAISKTDPDPAYQNSFDKLYDIFDIYKTSSEAMHTISRAVAYEILGEEETELFLKIQEAQKKACNMDCSFARAGRCSFFTDEEKASCPRIKQFLQQ